MFRLIMGIFWEVGGFAPEPYCYGGSLVLYKINNHGVKCHVSGSDRSSDNTSFDVIASDFCEAISI
jgi:hypothetical protein